MPRKKSNSGEASISALFTHITYIREKIDDLDKKVDAHINNFENCRKEHNKIMNNHNARLQKLEDWKYFEENQWLRKVQKHGLLVGILAMIVSAIISIWSLVH